MTEILIAILVITGLAISFFKAFPVFLMKKAQSMGIKVELADIIAMRFRSVDPELILNAAIAFHRNNISIEIQQLESHFLAEGDLKLLLKVMMKAKSENKELSYIEASAIVLSGEIDHSN